MRLLAILSLTVLAAADAAACSRMSEVVPEEIVAQADLIVRATAVEYDVAPAGSIRTTGTPESTVRFEIQEIVKGRKAPTEITLPAYLNDKDDYNELPVPYTFVRRNGRSGSCVANTYRKGADYLLMLKLHKGAYTVNWYALGPTNEQLRSGDDPWLLWVREQAAR